MGLEEKVERKKKKRGILYIYTRRMMVFGGAHTSTAGEVIMTARAVS